MTMAVRAVTEWSGAPPDPEEQAPERSTNPKEPPEREPRQPSKKD